MSEIQPSVIEQLSEIHQRLDRLITYESDVCGKETDNLAFYMTLENKVFDKIREIKKSQNTKSNLKQRKIKSGKQ